MTHTPNYRRLRDNPDFRENFVKRAQVMSGIRDFFSGAGFLEVETPILVRLPGMEPYLDVFRTEFVPEGAARDGTTSHDSATSRDGAASRDGASPMYLITSPEYAMKKLLVGGMEKIFQLTKSFRNKETGGSLHNPEFTILEWYRANADYNDIMRDTEGLVRSVCRRVHGGRESFVYQGELVDVSGEFERLRVWEAFERYAGVSREVFESEEALIAEAVKRGYSAANYDDAFFLIFLNEIEGKLGRGNGGDFGAGAGGGSSGISRNGSDGTSSSASRPTILYEYPVSMAALSRACPDDPRYAERFEVYVCGLELANAFSELTDAGEQEKRLRAERAERARLNKDLYDVDESFIDALKLGMPPSGGIALGVDRLVMLLLDKTDIQDVLLFPYRDL